MMLTKPDCRLSLAFTTTLMLSSLREGSQRLKACRHREKLSNPTLFWLFVQPTLEGIGQVHRRNTG